MTLCIKGDIPTPMNKLSREARAQILGLMVEGMSMRAISRITGASKNTIVKLLEDAGEAFSDYQDRTLRNLTCKRVQVDEIWAFCYAKAKNVTLSGDVWTWMAIDADTKLIPSWIVGPRDGVTARIFVNDLASRLADRIQLTSDGVSVYLQAVERTFRGEVDYAPLAYPDPEHVSTSYIEPANPTMRMGMRRFTRLTNGFSKKIENHSAAVAIHLMHYNFSRIHKTLRVAPAMAAGVSDHLWSLEEIASLAN